MSAAADSTRVAADLSALGLQGAQAMRHLVNMLGARAVARVKANASGRPGPRRIHGNYTRSMNVQYESDGTDVYAAVVGTNAPQARRLEYGFVGYDSLGRYYHQGPLPHWRPMADEMERRIEDEANSALGFLR